MPTQELFLVARLFVAIINGAALSVGIGILGNQGQFCYPAFCRLYRGKGAVPLICQSGQFVFQRLISINPMLGDEVQRFGSLFQILQLRPVLKPGTLFTLILIFN